MGAIIIFDRNQMRHKNEGENKRKKSDKMCTILDQIRNKSPMDLLEKYDIPLTPPIDIEALLENIGISIIEKDFANVEEILKVEKGMILGAVFSDKDDLAIFTKEGDSPHRKKFTLAHELAHCCNDCPDNKSEYIEFRRDLSNDVLKYDEDFDEEREKNANIFAGELLIPQKTLHKFYDKMILPSLTKLAEVFDVSTTVMAARLDYLKWPYYKDVFTEDKEPILYER